MADGPLFKSDVASTPDDYELPSGPDRVLKSVQASFNGSAATSPFQAAVQILAPSGAVVATAVCQTTVAAGGSADVTWFPGLDRSISSATIAFVGARISTNTSQTIAAATPVDLVYQVVDFDTGGFANLGANARILTAPTSGLYLVSCNTAWAYNNEGFRSSGVLYNGYASGGATFQSNQQLMPIWAPINDPHTNNEPHTTTQSSELIKANAGDFFSSGCTQHSGGNLLCNDPPSGSGYLSAVLIGA